MEFLTWTLGPDADVAIGVNGHFICLMGSELYFIESVFVKYCTNGITVWITKKESDILISW